MSTLCLLWREASFLQECGRNSEICTLSFDSRVYLTSAVLEHDDPTEREATPLLQAPAETISETPAVQTREVHVASLCDLLAIHQVLGATSATGSYCIQRSLALR